MSDLVSLHDVVETLRRDERPRTVMCRNCGSTEPLEICGDADRVIFGCRMVGKPEPWADFIQRKFGSDSEAVYQ